MKTQWACYYCYIKTHEELLIMGNSWEKMDFSYSLFPGLQDLAPFNSFFTGIFPLIWGRHLVWAVASLYSSTTAFCKVQENLIQLIRETGE